MIDRLAPEEIRDALFLVQVCEGRTLTPDEAAEARRRILARAAFLGLPADAPPADASGPVEFTTPLP